MTTKTIDELKAKWRRKLFTDRHTFQPSEFNEMLDEAFKLGQDSRDDEMERLADIIVKLQLKLKEGD